MKRRPARTRRHDPPHPHLHRLAPGAAVCGRRGADLMRRARTLHDIGFYDGKPGFIDHLIAWGFWTVAALAIGVMVALREGWL